MIISLWPIVFITIAIFYYLKVGRKAYYLRNLPALPTRPIVGNIYLVMNGLSLHKDVTSKSNELHYVLGLFRYMEGFCEHFFRNEKIYVLWQGWQPCVILYGPDYIEEVLSSGVLIEKSINYDYLRSWLGNGLLLSTGKKWHSRRKLLTPAFHFRILENFVPLMNEHSMVLVEKLAKNRCVDITQFMTRCTLDIISETAMGVKIDAQNKPDSDYMIALHFVAESFLFRNFDFIGWYDFIFYRTSHGKEYLKQLNVLHEFTRNVIKERKQRFIANKSNENQIQSDNDLAYGQKKRLALLDLLLEQQFSSTHELTDEEIREEVDTFMFEGHDTTNVSISWCLYMIGLYPDIQQKLHAELDIIFANHNKRQITSEDLKKLKYLECCIKESMRIFPPVPAIGRAVNADFKLKNYTIPKGSTIIIFPLSLHKRSDTFPQPELFIPERFLPENVSRLHPYAYIPFSAGPRNCIGQRFALTEEKIVIANVLRNFTLTSVDHRDKMTYAMELVLRPKVPIKILCKPR